MAKFGRPGRSVYVRELGQVRVRGLSLEDLAALPDDDVPDTMPEKVDPRHPAVIDTIAAGLVSPKLTNGQVAQLGEESLSRLQAAILGVHPQTRRLLALVREERRARESGLPGVGDGA